MKIYIELNSKYFLFSLFIFLLTLPPVGGQQNFSSFMDKETDKKLQWSGSGSLISRYYANYGDILNSKIDIYPVINLNIDYILDNSEFHGSLNLPGQINLSSLDDVSLYLKKMIDEAYIQLYFNGFNIETGYVKTIWGKGNKFFTFDNINALDYTDFLNPDYIDRKISEPIVKVSIPYSMQGLIEAVYSPAFTYDIYPSQGEWVMANSLVRQSEDKYLDNGQLGLRISNSIGGFDIGTSYQFSFFRKQKPDPLELLDPRDRIHLFGLETAFVIAAFNIRSELAYYMTKDISGSDIDTFNNRLQYLFSFDRDILIHNISFNFQIIGEYIFNTDNIPGPADIEYVSNGVYNSNLIIAGLKDTFFNEKLLINLEGSYSMENYDLMVSSELDYNFLEDTWLNIKYSFFYGDSNTFFGQYTNNDFLEIKIKYSF
jgi:hypothetical protein